MPKTRLQQRKRTGLEKLHKSEYLIFLDPEMATFQWISQYYGQIRRFVQKKDNFFGAPTHRPPGTLISIPPTWVAPGDGISAAGHVLTPRELGERLTNVKLL